MKFDPKLRAAMAEIKNICKKHDIGGHFILASPTHAEFAMEIENPSWSMVQMVGKKGKKSIVFRSRTNKPDQCTATAHMIFSIRDLSANAFMMFDGICKQLESSLGIEHDSMIGRPPDSTPDN